MEQQPQATPRELERAGAAVRKLDRPAPPADLAERTLARIAAAEAEPAAASAPAAGTVQRRPAPAPERTRSWWLRRITNPAARMAAMLFLMVLLGLVVNLDTGERIGRASERLLGAQTTDRIERLLDRVLVAVGPVEVSDRDVARLVGMQQLPKNTVPEAPRHKTGEPRPTTSLRHHARLA